MTNGEVNGRDSGWSMRQPCSCLHSDSDVIRSNLVIFNSTEDKGATVTKGMRSRIEIHMEKKLHLLNTRRVRRPHRRRGLEETYVVS